MIPSATDLSYFIEVASSSNLSRAAERLGVSQPSLTLAIQRLEASIGTALFLRSKKGVSLTQAGKQVLAHSQDLVQRWENVKTQALASTHEIQGHYRLGCHPSVALYALPDLLPDLLEKNPRLEIKLTHDLSRKVAESVIRGETDLGIVVNPIRHPDLVIRRLCGDEVTFWVGPGQRTTQDFRSGEAVLICDPDLLQTQDLLKKLVESKVRYRRILTSSSLGVIARLVQAGAGIGILPGRVVSGAENLGKMTRIPGSPVFKDDICLLYRVENKGIRTIQVIAAALMSVFNNDAGCLIS